MESFLKYLVIIHVVAGACALLFGLLAFLLRTNTPRHRPMGKIYFWCMTVVFVTAIILSLLKTLVFFFFIAVFTYYSVAIAYRAIKFGHKKHLQKPGWIDWFIQIMAGLVFLGAFVYGGLLNRTGGSIIVIVFSSFGLMAVIRNTYLHFKGTRTVNDWLLMHIGHMMGSYVGAVTAFLVNQTDHIPVHPLFLWFGPSVVLIPLLVIEFRKARTKTVGGS